MKALGWRLLVVTSATCGIAAFGYAAAGDYVVAGGLAAATLLLAIQADRVEQREFTRTQTEKAAAASSSDFARLARAVEILNDTVGVQQQRFDVFTTNFTAAQALRPAPQRGADGHFTSPIRRG